MINGRTVKATRTNNMMAFLTVEDLYGTVEVIVFPRDYEKYRTLLEEDTKVFIQGRVTVEEDKPAKLICSGVVPFDAVEKELWIQFPTRADYEEAEQTLFAERPCEKTFAKKPVHESMQRIAVGIVY